MTGHFPHGFRTPNSRELPVSCRGAACGNCTLPHHAEAMIIRNQEEVTTAVLAELERASDPRFKEIMTAAV